MADKNEPDLSSATAAVTAALDEVAPVPATVASPNRWAEPAARLRATNRWTLAVFGVIGSAFLAALPFSDLNTLEWPSWTAGLMLAAVISLVGGLLLVLRAGGEVFISRIGSLTDFMAGWTATSRTSPGYTKGRPYGLEFPRHELLQGMASTPEELVEEWERARHEYWRAAMEAAIATSTTTPLEAEGGPPSNRTEALKQISVLTKARFVEIDDTTTYITSLAAYRELVRVYRWAQRWISIGAVMVAVGVFIFFGAAKSSAADDESSDASASESVTELGLSTTDLENCSSEEGRVVIRSIPEGGEVAIRSGTTCRIFSVAPGMTTQSDSAEGADTNQPTSDLIRWTTQIVPWSLQVAAPAVLILLLVIAFYLWQSKQLRQNLGDSVLDFQKQHPKVS